MVAPTQIPSLMKVKILNWKIIRTGRNDPNLHQNQDGQLSRYQHPNTSGPRSIDNTPAWLNNEDIESKSQKNIAINGSLLNVASEPNLRATPLPLDNRLPAATLWFGTSVKDKN